MREEDVKGREEERRKGVVSGGGGGGGVCLNSDQMGIIP
jgi:hypothetical protein